MSDVAKTVDSALESAARAFRAGVPAAWDARLAAAAGAADGRLAASTDASCAGSLAHCLKALRDQVGEYGAGDVLVTNDVYHGSTHPTEITAAAPLVRGGCTVAWAVLRSDLPDIGGWEMGGYSPRSLDIWSDGARIVPARAFRAGAPRREVLDMLQLNSRTPRLNLACVTALGRAALGLADTLSGMASALSALADSADARARAVLVRVERGQGKAPLRAPGTPELTIGVKLEPRGGRLAVSFPGLPAASTVPLNATPAMTLDWISAAVAATLRIESPAAVALHRLVDLELAPERLLSASRRRPAGWARALTGAAVFRAACDALGASGGEPRASADPHFDAAAGRLAAARCAAIEAIERGL
jgi:N-methylhydantoinase B